MEKQKFIVAIDSEYVRDSQYMSGDKGLKTEDEDILLIDEGWCDAQNDLLLGIYYACCMEQALKKASTENKINPEKLSVYAIADSVIENE